MPVTPGTDELTELEQLAIDTATEAGRFILDERPAQLRVAETKSSATDVVTVRATSTAASTCSSRRRSPTRSTPR